jgi:hypothetical protein
MAGVCAQDLIIVPACVVCFDLLDSDNEAWLQTNCLSTLSLSWGGSKFLKTPLDLRR